MATVDVTDKLVGIWYLQLTETSDWLLGLTEIEPEKRYQISYRFRYYKDDKAFDSDDERSSYRGDVHSTRSYAIASVRHLAIEMENNGAIGKVDEILVVDRDLDRFHKELMDKPWAFVRIEGKPTL